MRTILDYPYSALIAGTTQVWSRSVLAILAALIGTALGAGAKPIIPPVEAMALAVFLLPALAMGHPISIVLTAITAGAWLNLLAGSRYLPECLLAILLYYLIGAYMIVGTLGSSYSIVNLCVLIAIILLLHVVLRIQAKRRLERMT